MQRDLNSFSKDIANTVGLQEAVLLNLIGHLSDKRGNISLEEIKKEATFWSEKEIQIFLINLEKKGLVIRITDKDKFYYSLKFGRDIQKEGQDQSDNQVPDASINSELIHQLIQYGIPEDFAKDQIEDFKFYKNEKRSNEKSWRTKFLRFVIKRWRKREVEDYKMKKRQPIDSNWIPDNEVIKILSNSGVDGDFINNELPEFILYWNERKEESDAWNSKFISHVRRQWARNKNLIENIEDPILMDKNWKPSEDFFVVLEMSQISRSFAEALIPEFILYWQETGQKLNSWNSKFLQHVKFHWEKNKGMTNQVNPVFSTNWEPNQNFVKGSNQPDRNVGEKLKSLKEKYQI